MKAKENNKRSELSVGEIFRYFSEDYAGKHKLSKRQLDSFWELSRCRTAALGGHLERCEDCGHERPVYNSCGNLHCPTCQGFRRREWLEKRMQELLPVNYFHCVFTIPHELNEVALRHPREVYNLLFKASSQTLLSFSKKKFQVKPAMISVLHTWGQNLNLHPHVHTLITGGGLKKDGNWVSSVEDYLFDVRELSADFRQRFMRGLNKLRRKEDFYDLADQWQELQIILLEKDWVVYCKKPFAGAEKVLAYLGRYVYRSAIANSRIKGIEAEAISFDYKDYRKLDGQGQAEHKIMRLKPNDFIQRFLLHILPKNFQRCRYFGLFAGNTRKIMLKKCQRIFARKIALIKAKREKDAKSASAELSLNEYYCCPECGGSHFCRGEDFSPMYHPPPDFPQSKVEQAKSATA